MALFIQVQNIQLLNSVLRLRTGDLVLFRASGGHVRSGTAVEMLGSFLEGLMRENGETLAPMGAPDTVMFRASAPGQARIDVVMGDPFHNHTTRELEIIVE